MRGAGTWLAGEIEKLRKKVEEAEAKVEAFRGKTNLLVGPNGTTLSAQQLGEMNAQLGAARTLKADAEAKAKLIRQMLKAGEEIQSSDVLNSELIRRLSEQRVTLRAQLAEQSVVAARQSSAHQGTESADRRPRPADQARSRVRWRARSKTTPSSPSARVDSQTAMLDQFKNQASSTNEQDVQLRALEREAKSQRDLLESYLAKYREATARDNIASAPPDARIISRASVSNVPAYPKKLPTVLIATFATFVVCCGIVVTREFLANPASDAVRAAGPRCAPFRDEIARAMPDRRSPASSPPLRRRLQPRGPMSCRQPSTGRLAARLAAVVKGRRPAGVPVSAIGEFAHNLQQRSRRNGSQIAFFGVAPHLGTSGIAIKFARALAQEARVVLVGLGAGDAAIRAISGDPSAPGSGRACRRRRQLRRHHHQGPDVRPQSDRLRPRAGGAGRTRLSARHDQELQGARLHLWPRRHRCRHARRQSTCRASRSLPRTRSCWSRRCRTSAPTRRASALRPPASTTSRILVAGRPDAAAPGATASATNAPPPRPDLLIRPRQRVRPEVAGPMTGSAGEGDRAERGGGGVRRSLP